MDALHAQTRIDAIAWYHDFDFGEGLTARSNIADQWGQRRLWQCIEQHLDKIDFRDKSVLDIGCWDGYWSFYAERRGAKSVLATDDQSQNWAGSSGIHLAKELLKSSVKVNLDVSVNHLTKLQQKFDVILFLGVYYHLYDPLYAFAQIRHCCHPNTLVIVDGPTATALPPGAGLFRFANHSCEFLPTLEALRQIVRSAYFSEVDNIVLDYTTRPAPLPTRLGWRWRLGACWEALRGSRRGIQDCYNRINPSRPAASQRRLMQFRPLAGVNDLHYYSPPFGLHVYDDRFCNDLPAAKATAA